MLFRASRYPHNTEGCALLPRHHPEPKELLSTDHFDAIPYGMDTGYSETIESFRTGSKPARVSFSPLT
jgi:hypothetical protein